MARPEHLALIERYVRAVNARDAAALRAMRTEDYTEVFPQSGERLRGRDTVAAAEAAFPDRPVVGRPSHVTSLGPDDVVVEALAMYGAEPWWLVARLGLEDGLVASEVAYYGQPFEPLAYRAAWVELFDAASETGDEAEPAPEDAIDRHDIEDLGRIFERGSLTDLGGHFDPAWVGEYPQSGERFPDQQSLIRAHDPYPGGLPVEHVVEVSGPEERIEMTPFAPIRVHGAGACWMLELENAYPDGSDWFQVVILRARLGRIRWTRWYWCTPFETPAWRKPFTEPAGPID